MITIDKELIFEFLLLPNEEISEEHIAEVNRVSEIVLNKYHPEAFAEYEGLKSQILCKIFENKPNYNPKFDAYNYVFTIARNESGNMLKKLRRELLTDEFWSDSDECEAAVEAGEDYESPIVKKYAAQLSGQCPDWDFLSIRQDEVLELLVFLHRFKTKEIPEYLKRPHLDKTLYFILAKLLTDEGTD